MSANKDTKTSLTTLYDGFSTGTWLKLWLFFLICFYFLGYEVPLSIFLGLVGGAAGGWVVGWWNTKDKPSETLEVQGEQVDEQREKREKVTGLRLAKQRRDAAKSRSQRRDLLKPLSKFLRR